MPAGVLITEPLPVPALEIDLATLILRVSPAAEGCRAGIVRIHRDHAIATTVATPSGKERTLLPGVAVRLTIVPLL